MKFLVDTNILLEILLLQARTQEATDFLNQTPPQDVAISDFTLYSVGIRLFPQGAYTSYEQLVDDLFRNRGIHLVRLPLDQHEQVAQVAQRFGLDYDDAYQYAVAELYNLTIVSFDADFDRTPRGRRSQKSCSHFPSTCCRAYPTRPSD
ncbi:MAG: PIN domain-containing protein [Fimbriimonadales bacterium]|nr:PIN domain-containing protein [Fimbriimonadales bacterium]